MNNDKATIHLRDDHGWDSDQLAELRAQGRTARQAHDDEHAVGSADHRHRLELGEVIARFQPQEWVDDYAVDVDPQGPTEWDATAHAADHLDYLSQLVRNVEKGASVIDDADVFVHDPDAPEWVREWDGPFTITLDVTPAPLRRRPSGKAVEPAAPTVAQAHADEHASGAPLGHHHLDNLSLVARITPEAWVDDNAVEVDPPGPTEWDATDHAEAHLDYVNRMFADAPEAWNGGTALDNDDRFADDSNAPQWVREWDGPFTIHLLLMARGDDELLAHLADDHGIDPAQVEPGSEEAWHADDHGNGDHHGHLHADDICGAHDEVVTDTTCVLEPGHDGQHTYRRNDRLVILDTSAAPDADAPGHDLTPTQREVAVEHVKVLLDVSKREAATVVDTIADTGTYTAEGVDTDLLLHVVDAAVDGRGHDVRAVAAMLSAMGMDADWDARNGVSFGTYPRRLHWSGGNMVRDIVRGGREVDVPDANPRRAAKALGRLVADD